MRIKILACLAAAALAIAALPAGLAAGDTADDIAVASEAILAGPGTARTAATTTTACTDTAYALAAWRLSSTYKWYYNPSGAPASVASTALTALQNASQTMATGRNRCGIPASLSTTQQYAGSSTRTAQITSSATCAGNDGYSVTSWGTLPSGYLGYTCVYYRPSTGAIISSDMMLDKAHAWFTTLPATCSGAFDVQTVATHERGHTAGLAHVDQTTHAVETMSPSTRACDISERYWALGDLTGLTARYATP
ncbi:MAG TPA: matrixin family metalloprotease [Amycolatopsis sp.]|nr:matrixin family metalloprotease [Amycolatopsis sp.]